VLVAPADLPIHLSSSPLPGLRRQSSREGARRSERLTARDVPALKVEPAMPPVEERLAQAHVSTFPDWPAVGRFYWGLARDQLDVDEDLRRRAHALVQGLSDDRAKVAAIYRYAATETRYVALEFGIEGIRPRRAALSLARGWGDCKDKAALVVAMLREIGIEAELVLVRSGLRGGFDSSTASLAPFDHAVAYVPKLDLYLDGTAEATGTTELPALDRAALALRISAGAGVLTRLPDPSETESVIDRTLSVELSADGALRFSARLSNRGVFASEWRQRYHSDSTRRDRVAEDLSGMLGPVRLDAGRAGLEASDLDAIEQPVTIAAQGTGKAGAEAGGWVIPLGSGFEMVARFATRPTRTEDVLVGPRRQLVQRFTVKLPAGTSLRSGPRPVRLDTPFGRFRLELAQQGDEITVLTELTLTRSRIAVADYSAWRQLCQQIDAVGEPRLLVGP
jgi:hypothetical protein